MEVLLAAVVLVLVAVFVTAPLRRRPEEGEPAVDLPGESRIADLEARKEAKYREIRDAELDHAQGKLSDDDFARIDGELRADAIALLKELDRARDA